MECRSTDLQDLVYGFLDEEAEARVRDHAETCGRCRVDLRRLEEERVVLARAALLPSRKERPALVPLAFAAALLAGLLWLLWPAPPPPAPAPAAQEAKKQEKPPPKEKPDPAQERVSRIKRELESVYNKLKRTSDPVEQGKLEKIAQELNQELKLLSQGNRPEIPIKEAEARLQTNPDDVEALLLRASWYLDGAKGAPALQDLNRAIELKPDHASAHLKRALAHAWLGHKTEAWKDAKRGEELDPKASKEIEATYVALKKILAPKERRSSPAEVEQQVAALRERLEELKAMAANADLDAKEREKAVADAVRVEAEIARLQSEGKSAPPEKKKSEK